MPTSQQPQDLSTIVYRLSTLEQEIREVRQHFLLFTPTKENELQLQIITSTVERIAKDVTEVKSQVGEVNDLVGNVRDEMKDKANKSQGALDKWQLNAMGGTLGVIVTVLIGVLIAYATHLIHP